jgi:hypothetical protein
MIKRWAITLTSLAVASGLTLTLTRSLSAPAAGKTTATTPNKCTTAGARWKWGKQQGNRYRVYPAGTTCSFANRWSARLSHERPVVRNLQRVIRNGPRGWTCYTRFPIPFPRAWAGTCSKGRRSFGWLPLLQPAAQGP